MAIDGTKYNLPNNAEMKEIYGYQKGTNEQPQALGSCLYDVLNGIVMDALIAPFNANERIFAKHHIEELSKIHGQRLSISRVNQLYRKQKHQVYNEM